MTISRSPLSSIVVWFIGAASLSFLAFIGLLLVFELFNELVQFLEALIPYSAIGLEPIMKFAKRLPAQLVKPLLGARLHVDHPGLLQYTQVLGDLRLVEP